MCYATNKKILNRKYIHKMLSGNSFFPPCWRPFLMSKVVRALLIPLCIIWAAENVGEPALTPRKHQELVLSSSFACCELSYIMSVRWHNPWGTAVPIWHLWLVKLQQLNAWAQALAVQRHFRASLGQNLTMTSKVLQAAEGITDKDRFQEQTEVMCWCWRKSWTAKPNSFSRHW